MKAILRTLPVAALLFANTLSTAGLLKDPASACAVSAPGYLGSSDYALKYTGECRDGLAHGRGKADWTLVNSPSQHEVWEGQFSKGMFLPQAKGIESARWLNADSNLFTLGKLPAQPGLPDARLHVTGLGNLAQYADPCSPQELWITNASAAGLADDHAAKALLQSAVDKLKLHCGGALDKSTRRTSNGMAIKAVSNAELVLDGYKNLPQATVFAFVNLRDSSDIKQYSNEVSRRQKQQLALVADQQAQQASTERLRAFFNTHKAQSWASLTDISKNPFRYAEMTVVTAVGLDKVLTPTRALVLSVGERGYSRAAALAHGEGIGQWPNGSRLLVVKVNGRLEDEKSSLNGAALVQVMHSEACTQADCSDWLSVRLKDGKKP